MAEQFVRVRPPASDEYLANPHKGCCTFQHFNGDELYPGMEYSEEGPVVFPPPVTKKKLTREAFVARWQAMASNPFSGDLQSVVSNGMVLLEGESAEGRAAGTLLLFRFSKSDIPMRRTATLKKDDNGQWKIDDLPELFPTPAAPTAAPGSGAPADVTPR